MKTLAAIIDAQPDAVIAAVTARAIELRQAEAKVEELSRKLDTATSTAEVRRRELGLALLEARKLWPDPKQAQAGARGPQGLTWEQFLEREGLNKATAWRYMEIASGAAKPDAPPARAAAAVDIARLRADPLAALHDAGMSDDDIGKLVKRVRTTANVHGGSGEVERGTYCTPKKYALAVGPWDLDPFSNPRSHIVSAKSCQLERGDDGLFVRQTPGSYWIAPGGDESNRAAAMLVATEAMLRGEVEASIATSTTRTWIQPPYEIVLDAIRHYGHTRFCALLRLDTSTEWFEALWALTDVIAIPRERLEFEAPPGIETSANPYPHALYYACERDVTDEIRKLCIVLRTEH